MHRYSRMKLSSGLLTMLAICAIIAGPSAISAQEVAVGQATATVLQVLVVTAEADLQFGDVMQGVPKSAGKTVVGEAGEFKVVGEGGKEVSLDLDLPPFLWNSTGGSEDRLQISFSSTDADLAFTAASTPAAHGVGAIVDQNPAALGNQNLGAAAPDNLIWVFLGGTVHPTVDQRAGSYSADIVFTAAYTGL
ncbi:MAG: hypothetical protein JSV44_11815 [Candidatus Zixiibacteriota bacterium]|nr:MAG: hypothetical protein JSV44_11815 [candidate division Zixibacteria bacterium]